MTEKKQAKTQKKQPLTPFEKWVDEITEKKVDKISIVMHDNPDPDAIASAFALYKIMEKLGVESEIFWSGEMNHTQNKKFVNITGIGDFMTKLNGELNERILNRFRDYPIVIVDTSCAPGTGKLATLDKFLPEGKQIDLVIDHHEGQTVDPKYYHSEIQGSCATIFYGILKRLRQTGKMDPVLATALYFGIEKDTIGLRHKDTTEEDRECHKKLQSKIDDKLYYDLVNFKYPIEKLDIDRSCYKFLHHETGLIISGAGFVMSQKSAFLASVADDLFVKYEHIKFVCVLGITYDEGVPGSEKLVVSVRYDEEGIIDTDNFMKETFGENFGGRNGMAGGSCSLGSDFICALDAVEANDNEKKDQIFEIFFAGWTKRIINTRKKMS